MSASIMIRNPTRLSETKHRKCPFLLKFLACKSWSSTPGDFGEVDGQNPELVVVKLDKSKTKVCVLQRNQVLNSDQSNGVGIFGGRYVSSHNLFSTALLGPLSCD